MTERPLIGCGTYRKTVDQTPPIEVYGLMPAYVNAVRAAGGIPILIPLGLDADEVRALLARVDGLLLPGGGDVGPAHYGGNDRDPTVRDIDDARDRAEFLLIEHALEQAKPLLAICRGLQIFNVALGGSLWEDVHHHMPGAMAHDYFRQKGRDFLAHDVTITPGSLLARALALTEERSPVNSLHHQGIRRLAPGLRAVATAPDGLIEAVEVPDHPFALGVQWHPENLVATMPPMRSLFHSFVKTAATGNGRR